MRNPHNGRGNRVKQKQKRKARLSKLDKAQFDHAVSRQLIDGNFSVYAMAYCPYYKGYLTQGLIDTHRCIKRGCKIFEPLEFAEIAATEEEIEVMPDLEPNLPHGF